jgi:adenylate kinase family enzyme
MITVLNSIVMGLQQELEWLGKVIAARFALSYGNNAEVEKVQDLTPPDLGRDVSYYAEFVREHQLSFEERLTLILCLVPYLRPALLDPLLVKNPDTDKPFTEFGGFISSTHSGLLPTGQTALFLLTGDDLAARQSLLVLFSEDHLFYTLDILHLGSVPHDEPYLSGVLAPSAEFIHRVLTGKKRKVRFNIDFPAKQVETGMQWSDLVLDPSVMNSVEEILTWLKYSEVLMNDWGMHKKLKPGYRCLFYGPPGTGKTLTATLLGKHTGRPVFQIDLSMVVSKYIGETEKNLGKVFDAAQNKNWILFFDEADALFGKRTKVSDSHDRYANQEVSYLLQRVEEYPGLVILATNLKANLDDAFIRRFQTVVHFPVPRSEERNKLWLNCFPPNVTLHSDINMRHISSRYEISGGSIINVVQYVCLQALRRGDAVIMHADLQEGIRREFNKDGKTV